VRGICCWAHDRVSKDPERKHHGSRNALGPVLEEDGSITLKMRAERSCFCGSAGLEQRNRVSPDRIGISIEDESCGSD